MIKYIGSKRVLVPTLVDVIGSIDDDASVVDFFAGTSRVGHALKRRGHRVEANDHLHYAHALATCYVQADREAIEHAARPLIDELGALPGRSGYFTHTFCEQSRYLHPKNGERVDAIREAIARKCLPAELEAVCLVSLMEAADRVDSTTGVQMAYLKQYAARASRPLELRLPDVLPRIPAGSCRAHRLDALDAADRLDGDVAYIDPPYNQHAYLGNYHVWESLILWDKPEVYGVACKRVDCRERKSPFNRRPLAVEAFREFIGRVRCPRLVVSFNDEGFIDRPTMESILGTRGIVLTIARDHDRYVGARIGIHNPQGKRVGTVGRLRNTEFIYVVLPEDDPAHESLGETAAALL